MSQNNEWPDWITATGAVLGVLGVPAGWVTKRLLGSVTRKEFQEYLEKRDELSTQRHSENIARLDKIAEEVKEARERLARTEGRLHHLRT